MIPSNYISVNCLMTYDNRGGICFDTGIKPSNDLSVNALFRVYGKRYVFGARNTNSTSSVGQFGFYADNTSTANNAIMYHNAQKKFTTSRGIGAETYIQNTNNVFIVNDDNMYVYDIEATEATFTGNYNIYIGGINNAGTVNYGTVAAGTFVYVRAFRFFRSGSLIANIFPVYKIDTAEFGLYDSVNDTFMPNMNTTTYDTYHTLEVTETEGGVAYIETNNAGNVKKQVMFSYGGNTIRAVPSKGYEFLNWTSGGNVVSTDEVLYDVEIGSDDVYTANFIKETDFKVKMKYTLLGVRYGFGLPDDASDPEGRYGEIFANVRDFHIKEDALSRQTSIIECDSVPSALLPGCPVSLYSPKGKSIYTGIVDSIENNTVYCREVLAMFDTDYIFRRYMNSSSYSIHTFMDSQIKSLQTGSLADVGGVAQTFLVKHRYAVIGSSGLGDAGKISFKRPNLISMPTHNASIENMEQYYQNIFNDYGLYIKGYLRDFIPSIISLRYKGNYKLLSLKVEYNDEDILVFGDNVECITNISVQTESEHTTLLIILDGASTNFRAAYAIKNDGTIEKIDPMVEAGSENYIAYNECVPKIIWSDDSLQTLVEGNLVNGIYNHKITFDVDLSEKMFRLEDFDIGRRVNFYYKDKMFNSVITGREFTSNESHDRINSVHLTLGKVRSKLTEKMNLGIK